MKGPPIVYDIEIVKAIPDRKYANTPGIEYCAGWRDFAGMGIAVLCAIDLVELVPRVFLADNMDEFKRWSEGRVLCGHSNHAFDDEILKATGNWTAAGSWDLLRHLRGDLADYLPLVPK